MKEHLLKCKGKSSQPNSEVSLTLILPSSSHCILSISQIAALAMCAYLLHLPYSHYLLKQAQIAESPNAVAGNEEVLDATVAMDDDVVEVPLASTSSTSPKPSECIPPPAKKTRVCGDMRDMVVITILSQKEILEEKVAKFFYGCNIPFNVVEHPLFKDLVQSLRPGFTPPTRKKLGDQLLNKVHSNLQENMHESLKDKTVTLVEDGWSDPHNNAVIARCLNVDGKSFLLDTVEAGTMEKSGDNCADLCRSSITQAEEKFKCRIGSVVTDNAKNMEKMRRNLQEEDGNLVVYGCLAHILNLLGSDITPSAIMKHIVEVQTLFRDRHRPSAWLREYEKSIIPQLPGDTRWKSQLECLSTFVRNHAYYMDIVVKHRFEIACDAKGQRVADRIMDTNLYVQANDLISQLTPIADALDRAQSDQATIADACDIFYGLVNNDALQAHKVAMKKRFDMALRPCHFAAYLLHPKYKGAQLSNEQTEKAHDWLYEKNPDFLCAAIAFKSQSKPFQQFLQSSP
jgi:hypothetical protein